MPRATHVLRVSAFVALLAMTTHAARMNALEAAKGFRALVFSGDAIREPIRVGDFDTATDLYLRMMRGQAMYDSVSVVSGRRCIIVSAFLANQTNMNTAVEALPAGGGDFNYRLYILEQGTRPIMMAGTHLWRVTPEVAHDIAALGVPISDSTHSSAGCLAK